MKSLLVWCRWLLGAIGCPAASPPRHPPTLPCPPFNLNPQPTTNPGTFIPLKKWLVGHSSMDDFLTSLLAGAGAGCVGAAIGTPFQLIKTRMQVQPCGMWWRCHVSLLQEMQGPAHACGSSMGSSGCT